MSETLKQIDLKSVGFKQSLFENKLTILTIIAISSFLYTLVTLFTIKVIISFLIFICSSLIILSIEWKKLRQIGLVNLMTPKMKNALINRSIFDIYRDLVYYPTITKILGAFVRGAVAKPHPDQLPKMFQDLPQKVQKVIFTKGILHLAPQKIQKIIIQKDFSNIQQFQNSQNKQNQIVLPQNYGKIDKKWDKISQYQNQQVKIHELTMSKAVLIRLNQKIKWKHIIPLMGILSFALINTKKSKLAKIALYNGSFVGMLLLISLIIIKYKQPDTQATIKKKMLKDI